MPLVLLVLSIIGFCLYRAYEKVTDKKREEEFYKSYPELKNQLYERTPESIAYDKYKEAEQRAKDRLNRCNADRKDNKM